MNKPKASRIARLVERRIAADPNYKPTEREIQALSICGRLGSWGSQ